MAKRRLGNNNPQAGANPNVGNLQAEYAFGSHNLPFTPNASINPWLNTLRPETLRAAVAAKGIDPARWDMATWIRADNWRTAYAQRPRKNKDWDAGRDHPFRLFPALNPADLPAGNDGFVRTTAARKAYWHDGKGHNTGWRALNFMPYGIFTPQAGSVSGVYIRLPAAFMKNAAGRFDLVTYVANLDLLERHIQDRLLPTDGARYLGGAAQIERVRGQYPLGTEFAHPLHYVDVRVDGVRAKRVKEIRWMIKQQPWYPDEFGMALKEESAPVVAHPEQGWIENGTGWLLAGWIEDAKGMLRPQQPSELVQCVGCHSGNVRQSDIGQNPTFTSGTGNTIDSTWSFPRKFVGASLYGDMPAALEDHFSRHIPEWPGLEGAVKHGDVEAVIAAQEKRLALMRDFTARGGHLDAAGRIRTELFVPPERDALEAARRYRQVVVTQRYDFGKDVFAQTPLALRYFRRDRAGFAHQDGRPYARGEVISDRPVNSAGGDFTYGIGITPTLIDVDLPIARGGTFVPNYIPLLK